MEKKVDPMEDWTPQEKERYKALCDRDRAMINAMIIARVNGWEFTVVPSDNPDYESAIADVERRVEKILEERYTLKEAMA
jgi:hypothetical protein